MPSWSRAIDRLSDHYIFVAANSLTLNDVTRSITKVSEKDQGNSAVTYKVDGGWPDPGNGQIYVTAYAKTGKSESCLST